MLAFHHLHRKGKTVEKIENRTQIQTTRCLKVEYNGIPNLELDQILTEALSKAGFSFYGCGYNLITHMRDIKYVEQAELPMKTE